MRAYSREPAPGRSGGILKLPLTPVRIRSFRKTVYRHYALHGRRLPWRTTRDPYCILVSEVMLQQTQAERAVRKYKEFIAAFPDFRTLAAAPLRKILKVWQGLGYNRRVLALKRTAASVMNEWDGKLPRRMDDLQALTGIGPSTAAAIAAFAFDAPVVFVETNIRSVFIHLFFRTQRAVSDGDILPLVKKSLDTAHPRKWYNALMDYGAMLKATSRNPGRRSARYRKQSPFNGSDRQIRGKILKACLERRSLSAHELASRLKAKPERVRINLGRLVAEGLLKERAGKFGIA